MRPELCPFNDNEEVTEGKQLDHLSISGHDAETTTLDLMHCSETTASAVSPLCGRISESGSLVHDYKITLRAGFAKGKVRRVTPFKK